VSSDHILVQDGVQYGVQIAEQDIVIGRQLMDAWKATVSQIVFEFGFSVRFRGFILSAFLILPFFAKDYELTKRQRINGDLHVPPTDQGGKFRGQEACIGAGDDDIPQTVRQKRGDRLFPSLDLLDFINQNILPDGGRGGCSGGDKSRGRRGRWGGRGAFFEIVPGITIEISIVFDRIEFKGLFIDVKNVGAGDSAVDQSLDQQSHDDAFADTAHSFEHLHHRPINECFDSVQVSFPDDKVGCIAS